MFEDVTGTTQEQPATQGARGRRAYLRRACRDLEAALSAPPAGCPDERARWAREVTSAAARTCDAFAAHISITEGRDGLFEQVRSEAPRLEGALRRLHREHDALSAQLAAGLAQLETSQVETPDEAALRRAREHLTSALAGLSRHRQRGSDLLHQAYDIDIGGE
jgi:hypothetical protein